MSITDSSARMSRCGRAGGIRIARTFRRANMATGSRTSPVAGYASTTSPRSRAPGLSIESIGDRAAQAATLAAISEDDESTYHALRKSTSAIIEAIRSATRFMLGPFPLSVTIHLALILFLIITVHEQRGRELIMVNLEAGGGGGGGSEMNDLDMPEVPMPDTAPQQMEQPVAVDTSQAVGPRE